MENDSLKKYYLKYKIQRLILKMTEIISLARAVEIFLNYGVNLIIKKKKKFNLKKS